MGEEEKEAIKYFEDDIEFLEEDLKNPNFLERYITIHTKEFNYLRTILNLIEKQQKELDLLKDQKEVDKYLKDIESWKKYSNEQEEDIIAKNNTICDLEFKVEKQQKEIEQDNNIISDLQNEVTLKDSEIEKKNKIIDLMAEQLATPVHSKEWVIDYFTKKVEEYENNN